MPRFVYTSRLPAPVEEVFAWHERPGALARLVPPFLPARVERSDGSLEVGSESVLRLGPGGVGPRWHARHVSYDPPRGFRDIQVSGPFAAWEHHHRFDPAGHGATLIQDEVDYRLPLGSLGEALAGRSVRRRLLRMLTYRHRVTAGDLAAHAAARARGVEPMRIAVTGSSGFIGTELTAFLAAGGHHVVPVVRRAPRRGEIGWRPDAGEIDRDDLRGVDAVVHLAGESIASGRWTPERKRAILESRTRGTRTLAEAIAGLGADGPKILVSSSAVGYYGDRGGRVLTEDDAPGDDFLARTCAAWETATRPAAEAGARVVQVRTGVVQTPRGGALARQLPLFRLGLGGPFGRGRQYVSWISMDDLLGIYHHVLTTPQVHGPVNATAPVPVTSGEHARTLGRVLRRPAVLPVPRLGPKAVFGEMAEALVYSSQRVVPAVAQRTGYAYRHPRLEGALREVLGRPGPGPTRAGGWQ